MNKRLLVVEDEALIALALSNKLQALGYEVCAIAATGKAAIKKVAELGPDLVLMDIRLPGEMNGIEAALHVREEYDIPVIYITAHSDEETLEKARLAEPYGFLLKPFQERELRIGIEMAFQRHTMERRIRDSEEKFRLVTEGIEDVFWLNSPDLSELFYVSPAYETIWGRTCESLYQDPKSFLEVIHEDDRERVLNSLWGYSEKGTEIEYRLLPPNGTLRWIKDRRFRVGGGHGKPYRLSGIATDITLQKVAQEQLLELNHRLEQLATHDSLTGLPNLRLFVDRIEHGLAHARRFSRRIGVLFIDLDGFKEINDRFGHRAGDQALTLIARRLKEVLREVDTAARLGGDEFGIVLPDLMVGMDAEVVARKILDQISLPFTLMGARCQAGASVGISFYPEHGDSAEQLISRADSAMYGVKQSGKGGYGIFEPEKTEVRH